MFKNLKKVLTKAGEPEPEPELELSTCILHATLPTDTPCLKTTNLIKTSY